MYDTKRLEKLGLKKVSGQIDEMRERKRKMEVAYKSFRVCPPDKVVQFNEKLRKETLKEDKNSYSFKRLEFIPIEKYEKIPPEAILQKIEKAIEKDCFDNLEICKIAWHKEIKDPIVFGCINGCQDKFFIGQWDNDITIDEIMFNDTSKAAK